MDKLLTVLFVFVFLAALTVVIGWKIGTGPIAVVSRCGEPMDFNTALLFAVSALGAVAALNRWCLFRMFCGGFVLVIAGLSAFQWMTTVDLHIDSLFYAPSGEDRLIQYPMRPNTAVAFCWLAWALLLLRWPLVSMGCAIASLALGLLALVGYAFGHGLLAEWGALVTSMAPHTAVLLIILSALYFFMFEMRLRMRA